MAKSKKENDASESKPSDVEEAVVVESDDAPKDADHADAGAATDKPEVEADVEDAHAQTEEASGPALPEDEPLGHDAERAEDLTAAAGLAQEASGGSGGAGFWGMATGGVLAAAIGFLAAQYVNDAWPFGDGRGDLAALESRLSVEMEQLRGAAEAASAAAQTAVQPGDLTVLQDGQDRVSASMGDLEERVTGLGEQLTEFGARLDDVAKRPVAEGVSEGAIAAYERELEALRQAIAAQRAEVEAMTDDAAAMEENAEETARKTMARAAAARIRNAIDAGEGFATAIEDLQAAGVTPAAILVDAAEGGVATRAELSRAFPDAARAALRAWRADPESAGATGGGFGSFLRDQLAVRSVTPRDGDDPDAILSRAEAAVAEGRLADALAELTALPDSARGAVDAWEADARRRLDVRAAADALAGQLREG